MSFGFDCLDDDWSHDSEGNRVRTLRKVKLYDASPVTFPAYPQTDLAFRWATAGARRMINLELMRRQLELLAVG
jgi:phage head maturation protease